MTHLENKIIDHLNGELNAQEWENIISESKKTPETKILIEQYKHLFDQIDNINIVLPDNRLKDNFNHALNTEIAEAKTPQIKKSNLFKYMSQAAILILLLAVGLLIGLNIKSNQIIDNYADRFQHQQSDMLALLQEESSSERIKAINMSYGIEEPNKQIVNALIQTLLNDKSDNVRLASAEALSKFKSNSNVRNALIKSLEQESDEAIQIALINILAQMNEQRALKSFEKIIEDDNAVNFVRDEAYSGKLKLIETY